MNKHKKRVKTQKPTPDIYYQNKQKRNIKKGLNFKTLAALQTWVEQMVEDSLTRKLLWKKIHCCKPQIPFSSRERQTETETETERVFGNWVSIKNDIYWW